MLNQTVIVGRLVKDPELRVTETGKKVTRITLAVPRAFKNLNGTYDTDFIDCTLWTGIAECTTEYCQKGDMLGVKGRLQTQVYDKDDGTKKKTTEVIAEKVTFLSSRAQKDNEDISNEEKPKKNKKEE